MVFLRVLGKTLLFLAFFALAYDGARNLATPGEGLLLASVSAHLKGLLPNGAADLERAFATVGPSWFWTVFIGPLLALPLSLLLGGLGTALYLAGYRKPAPLLYGE
jgi:hypothetical protein